jgi:hypothetical protein
MPKIRKPRQRTASAVPSHLLDPDFIFDSGLYERLALSRDKKASAASPATATPSNTRAISSRSRSSSNSSASTSRPAIPSPT